MSSSLIFCLPESWAERWASKQSSVMKSVRISSRTLLVGSRLFESPCAKRKCPTAVIEDDISSCLIDRWISAFALRRLTLLVREILLAAVTANTRSRFHPNDAILASCQSDNAIQAGQPQQKSSKHNGGFSESRNSEVGGFCGRGGGGGRRWRRRYNDPRDLIECQEDGGRSGRGRGRGRRSLRLGLGRRGGSETLS